MKIKLKSRREKIIFSITVGVIACAVVFNYLIIPVFERDSRLTKEISLAEAKLQRFRWLLSQKDSLNEKYNGAGSKLGAGEDNSVMAALSELEVLAKSSGIRIVEIRPEASSFTRGQSRESLIELRAEGQIQGYIRFMYEIESSLSLFSIKKLQIVSRGSAGNLEARFTIVLFFSP